MGPDHLDKRERSHTQLDLKRVVIAFQDRVTSRNKGSSKINQNEQNKSWTN